MLAGLSSRTGSSSRRGPSASRSPPCGSRARCPRAGGCRESAGAWPARPDDLPTEGGACIPPRGRSLHQLLEALVELAAAAAGLGEEEAPLLDVFAQVLLGDGRKLGGLVAVEEDDRGLEQLRRRVATPGSTTCQVSRFFQSRETTFTMLRTSSGSLFQSPTGAMAQLVDQAPAPAPWPGRAGRSWSPGPCPPR